MRRRLGTVTALTTGLMLGVACADAPNTQRVTTTASSTTSSTVGSPTPTLTPGADERWFEAAEFEAAIVRLREAEAAKARANRSKATKGTKEASGGRSTTPTTTTVAAVASGTPDDAFWLRLSKGCECRQEDGCPSSGGWFQFKGDTARKAGYVPGSSYEDQLAAAKRWLGMIGGRGGTTAGWPRCWWRAQR